MGNRKKNIGKIHFYEGTFPLTKNSIYAKPPCYVDDHLWVRETWKRTNPSGDKGIYYYRADGKFPDYMGVGNYFGDELWRPSIHMPRCASRITLKITSVRVEKLNDISLVDTIAEGYLPDHPAINTASQEPWFPDFSRSWFAQIWDSIYGKGSWESNPWVWAISFEVFSE